MKLHKRIFSHLRCLTARIFGLGTPVLRILMLLVIACTLVVQTTQAQAGPQAPAAMPVFGAPEVVDNSVYFNNMTDRSMRIRVDGVPCVAYGGDRLFYSCYNSTLRTWVTEVVDASPRVGEYASLAFDQWSHPFIAYYDALYGRLKLAYNLGIGWTILVADSIVLNASSQSETSTAPSVPSLPEAFKLPDRPWREPDLYSLQKDYTPDINPGPLGVGKYTSIAIDINNRIHMSYFDEVNGSLRYAMWDGLFWYFHTVADYSDQYQTGYWSSIAVDSAYTVHISWFDDKYDDLNYIWKRDDGLWRTNGPMKVDTGGNVGAYTSIAVDINRYPHISYTAYNDSTYQLKYAKMNADRQTWTIKVVDPNNSGLYTSIALYGNNVHISYYDYQNGDLKSASSSGGDFSVSKAATLGNVGYFTSIALDSNHQPNIAYFNATKASYQFTRYNTVTKVWVTYPDINVTGDLGLSTSLALNNIGTPYISYFNDSLDFLKYAQHFGAGWSMSYVSTAIHAGAWSSIKVPDNNQFSPRIAYYDMDHGDLLYSVYNGAGWNTKRVETVGNTGLYVSMALQPDANPHFSYYDATKRNLMYATWDVVASDWYTHTVEYNIDDIGLYTSIALDNNNRPQISYFDGTNHFLKRAYLSPINAWITEVVDGSGVAGEFSSLAIDNAGYPHIAYYDAINKLLKYAYMDAGGWHYENVDNPIGAAVGLYCSLAYNKATDESHISYYDATNGDLKYAYRPGGGGWSTATLDGLTGLDVGLYTSIALNGAGLPGISYYDNSLGDLKFIASYVLPAMSGRHWIPWIVGP